MRIPGLQPKRHRIRRDDLSLRPLQLPLTLILFLLDNLRPHPELPPLSRNDPRPHNRHGRHQQRPLIPNIQLRGINLAPGVFLLRIGAGAGITPRIRRIDRPRLYRHSQRHGLIQQRRNHTPVHRLGMSTDPRRAQVHQHNHIGRGDGGRRGGFRGGRGPYGCSLW